jgi:hypothetical protein
MVKKKSGKTSIRKISEEVSEESKEELEEEEELPC